MTTTVLKRQFITDAAGNRIGVILPLGEFALVRESLDRLAGMLTVSRPGEYREDA